MENIASTRKDPVVPRVLTRVSSFGMTKTKTIKTPRTGNYLKVFSTKTRRSSSVAALLDLPTRRSLYLPSLHSYCLHTSRYFVKR